MIYLVLLAIASLTLTGSSVSAHRMKPIRRPITEKTFGSPWPLPQNISYGQSSLEIQPSTFRFVTTYKCDILQKAVVRYKKLVFPHAAEQKRRNTVGQWPVNIGGVGRNTFSTLTIVVGQPCEQYPYFGMNENYNLSVWSNGSGILQADAIWGALRGLETFSQLVYSPSIGSYRIRTATISDWPRFAHRGLLLDTSRHFVAVQSIMETLDLMAQNKLNVFHWHIVDDQSFPYQSLVFPNLTKKGAYSPRHVYSRDDIARTVEYARLRGVRVVPEFDTPGHTQSWGRGQPGLLSKCFDVKGKETGEFALLNPSQDSTWDFLLALFREILQTFPDKYLHLGGDEVTYQYHCWENNPQIKQWMKLWRFPSASNVEEFYFKNFLRILPRARANTGYLVWQEVLDKKINVVQDIIAHIWKGRTQLSINAELEDITRRGYKAILSSCWYLNYIQYGNDWPNFYTCEPQGFNGSEDQKHLILGGEVCIWGEFVDSSNLTPRLWPRASTVAERLWSAKSINNITTATPRLEEHRCRLLARGYPVEPVNGPGFCPLEWSP